MTDPLMKQTKQELVWMVRELEKDRARLDWLQHKGTTNIEADVQDRFGIDLDSDEYPKHKNLRAAIDAEMEAK